MKKIPKSKNYLLRVLMIFLITFICVMIVGTAAIIIYRAMSGNTESGNALETGMAEDVSHLFAEEIPERGQEGLPPEAEISEEEKPAGRYDEILSNTDYMKENNIYPKETSAEDEVILIFAGDILFDPGYSVMARLLQRQNGIYDSISQDLLEEMKNADIMMLNNEFPYSNRGMPTEEKQFTFRAKPESVNILGNMGVDIVSLANNHAYDYGETALLDTLDILKEAGMPYVGAGRDLAEASRPVYFIAGDQKIAYVSATQIERLENPDTKGATDTTPGVFRCWNPEKLLEIVKEAKENSDFVVVYIHWGTENTDQLDWAQLDQAPRLVDAGADLIIGDHPHCLQPIQYVKGVPVVYSLGNFWFNSRQVDTCLVKAVIGDGGLRSLQFIPALQKDCTTSMLYGEEKERVLAYMRSISPEITIDEDGYISE